MQQIIKIVTRAHILIHRNCTTALEKTYCFRQQTHTLPQKWLLNQWECTKYMHKTHKPNVA